MGDREKLIKAYLEIDRSIHRMRAWQHRLELIAEEIKGDLAAFHELQKEIETVIVSEAVEQEVSA